MKTEVSFLRSGHLPTLLSAFLYFDVSFMIWVLLGALANFVAADFGLTSAQKGLMVAIPLLGGSILRLLFGHLTDTIGAKKTGNIGLILTFVPLFGGWLWADSVWRVYLTGLLLGVAGASFAAALPLASRWYPAKYQGVAMGIAGAGNSGTLLATLFAPRLAEAYGWHAVFGFAIIPLSIVSCLFFIFAKDAPLYGKPTRSALTSAEFLHVLKEKDMYLFSLFYAVTFGGFVGLASFLSIFLRDQYGLSNVRAGDLTSLCVVAGSFLRPVGGLLADRLGGIRMLTVLYGLIALLMLGVAQLPALAVTVFLVFLVMACLGIGNGSVFQLVPQRFGQRVGIATGILGAAGGLGGFFLPTMVGWPKQTTGSYATGLIVLAGMDVVALMTLAVAQSNWIGVWISKHGLVTPTAPVPNVDEAKTI